MPKVVVATTLIVISLLVIIFFTAIQTFNPPTTPNFEVVTLEQSRLTAEQYLSEQNRYTDVEGKEITMVNAINTGCDSCWVLQFEFDSNIGVVRADVHMQDGKVIF